MVLVFLAQGFEEIEAVTAIDVLRRGGLDVITVGVGGIQVTGSHNITVTADMHEDSVNMSGVDAVVLPGGVPGTTNLEKSAVVQNMIDSAARRGTWICAICSAPSILGHKSLLDGRTATCFPGYEPAMGSARTTGGAVEVDRPYITGKGAGVAIDFALRIVSELVSPEMALQVRASMQCR